MGVANMISMETIMIGITGATGQLGRLVIDALLARGAKPSDITAIVRNPDKAADLAARGVGVRRGDYGDRAALETAFKGIDKLLLISSSEVGSRATQHANVIAAAKAARVPFIAYTSILKADRSPMMLAAEHVQTERDLAASGIPHALLRNGWYIENYLMGLAPALEHGAVLGAAGDGRISAAARADYADAAAAVLLSQAPQAGKTYELAGDTSFSLADLAATIGRIAGKPIAYKNLPTAELASVLQSAGLPEGFAKVLADADAAIATGALQDDSKTLSGLTGKPTTTLETVLKSAIG